MGPFRISGNNGTSCKREENNYHWKARVNVEPEKARENKRTAPRGAPWGDLCVGNHATIASARKHTKSNRREKTRDQHGRSLSGKTCNQRQLRENKCKLNYNLPDW